MANMTVTIPAPILAVGEKFKVRHRELPNGAFTAYSDKTTNSFALTGLTPGNYELEIVFVTADGVECEATYHYFSIAPDFTCWDFTATRIEDHGLFYIRLNFSGGTQPPCGWEITITPLGGSPTVLTYPTLPISNIINIPIPTNVVYIVSVTALLCNGRDKDCYTIVTSPTPTPPICIGATITDVQLLPPPIPPNLWTLFIQFSQSNPPTVNANITYQQIGTPQSATATLDSGSFIFNGYLFGGTPTASNIYLQNINPTPVWGQYIYNIRFLDRCGNWLTAQVAFG